MFYAGSVPGLSIRAYGSFDSMSMLGLWRRRWSKASTYTRGSLTACVGAIRGWPER